eukprot:TRINITY_DN2490_c1_g1_i5.p1 TRINITY_DN2490_c1_g1~~TRINITY_DN2490_c1_g1_i5.p1  ORF type:complete len:132 (+),score=3.17 TRINITY_DN2490_c1_g1_i5:472-867(+)
MKSSFPILGELPSLYSGGKGVLGGNRTLDLGNQGLDCEMSLRFARSTSQSQPWFPRSRVLFPTPPLPFPTLVGETAVSPRRKRSFPHRPCVFFSLFPFAPLQFPKGDVPEKTTGVGNWTRGVGNRIKVKIR